MIKPSMIAILAGIFFWTACGLEYGVGFAKQADSITVQEKQSASGATQAENADNADQATKTESLSPLISAADLKKLIDSKPAHVKILEPSRDLAEYTAGHLPTAQFVHWVDDMTNPKNVARYNNPTQEQFAKLMAKLGIRNEDRVIIYDRLNSRLSTRLFWSFKFYGHDQIQILDGGFESWQASFELSKVVADVKASEYKIKQVRKELLAEMNFVETQLKKPGARFIDGRPVKQFTGEEPGRVFHTHKAHPRNGHIPGSANIFWFNNFKEDGTFKSVEDLKTLYSEANIKPENDVITYCNEGLHAAPPWFVLTQLLDYKNVRLYDSSMAEWAESKNEMSIVKPGK